MEQCFKLYTWQLPDWDIIREKRDPSRGPLRWGDTWDRLQPLYKKLEKDVGTLDFLWCYAAYVHCKQPQIRRLWVLDVPSSKIFHFLDSEIWETMVDAVKNNGRPDYSRWDKLILERSEGIKGLSAGNNNDITPLVPVPLCTSIQIIDNSKFNKGSRFPGASAKYEDLPTSEREAKRCREEGYRKGAWRKGRNSLSYGLYR